METEKLRQNIHEQLDRLVTQLQDLEEAKDDLEALEYDEMKSDTKDQLLEFEKSLEKMSQGNFTLNDDVTAMKLAIRAAISEAFKTPEIIGLFAKKQPAQLRLKLAQFERDHKVQKLSDSLYFDLKCEVLTALSKLGEKLSPEEEECLNQKSNEALVNFAKVNNSQGSENKLMEIVKKAVN